MEGKPIIGINADYRSATKDKPAFSFLAAGYAEAVTKAGGIPVVLTPMDDPNDISQLLDTLHGVVLTGGADLDPRFDGFMMHPAVQTMERKRENFDRLLAKMILKRRMPVFGIGVGMQLLNVTQGGNLYLHIPEDMPESLPHRDALDRAHRHGLEVARNSLMERVYGDGEIRVNSMHHMAIDELGSAFRVTARCPDGIIEAIESVDPEKWFAVGTQFHPEAESASALDLRIFEEFIWGVKGEVPEARLVA